MTQAAPIGLLNARGKVPTSPRGKSRETKIVKVATMQFLKHGYGATSLDAISKIAGGSKSTLYSFFPSKADLFQSVVSSIVADMQDGHLDPKANIEATLVAFGCGRLAIVFAKQHWSLLKLIQAERDRFPRIAEAYYQLGPLRSREILKEYFASLLKQNRLNITDENQAAKDYIGTLMHDWYVRYLYTSERFPSKDEMRQHSRRVAKTFLDAHMVD